MLKLARRARGHFVTLIEIRVHLIRVKPGHISLCMETPCLCQSEEHKYGGWKLTKTYVIELCYESL